MSMTIEVPTNDPGLSGFTYIQKKHRKPHPRTSKAKRSVQQSKTIPLHGTIGELREKFATRKECLLKSDFYKDFQAVFTDLLGSPTLPRPKSLKMLGIGTLSHNPSLTQLSFGLELAKMLDLSLSAIKTSDPMYTALDTTFLTELGIVVESVAVGNQHDLKIPCLVFAPHVPKSVYEALLRAYWHKDSIHQLVLLGNNLRHYPDIYSHVKLKSESPAILAAGELLEVVNFPGNFEYNNVFNDLAIQWFKDGKDLPNVNFEGCEIETEHFEINQDLARLTLDCSSDTRVCDTECT